MPARLRGRRAAVIAVGALLSGAVTWAVGASADTTTATSYSGDCSAQLLALSLGGHAVPLDAGRSCATPGDSFFPVGTIAGPAQFPLAVDVLYEHTARSGDQSSAQARAGVAHVFLPLHVFGGPDVTVDVLTSEASCDKGQASGVSHVVGIDVGGVHHEVPEEVAGGHTIALGPLGYLELDQQEKGTTVSDTAPGVNPRVTTTTQDLTQTALHVVVLPGQAPGGAAVADLTVARTHVSCGATTTTRTTSPSGSPSPTAGAVGWMTGGGKTGTTAVTHSFVLPCTLGQKHPGPHLTLQVPGAGTFTLTRLTAVSCSTVAGNGDPEQPDAGFNTLEGKGFGDCNGSKDVDVSFTFTDGGEPNKGRDKDAVTTDEHSSHGCHVSVSGPTTNGNQQAHRGSRPPA